MKTLISNIFTALKGLGMGAANIVPGVSGGTIALLTGIYGELIEALNMLMVPANWKLLFSGKTKEFWKNIHGSFLSSLAVGVILSILAFSKLMEYVIVHHPVQTWAFFFGIIIASSVYMLLGIKEKNIKDYITVAIGCIVGVIICTLSPTKTPDNMFFIFICGAIAICTMILPGISGSFILVILGKYEYIIKALNNFDIPILAVFFLGCLIGILAFAKFLHWLMARYERQTLLALIGFVLGSLIKVWPWYDMKAVEIANSINTESPNLKDIGNLHIPEAIIWAIIGIAFVCAIEYFSLHKQNN